MKMPRDVSADELIRALRVLGYTATRQTGSHIRITTERGGQHHVTIPNHSPVKVGTVRGILKSVADHHALEVPDLLETLKL